MQTICKQRREMNKLTSENDFIYHQIAQKYGLSDNVLFILYYLYEEESGSVSQSDLCQYWLYSKQTINSSVSALVDRGWVKLVGVPNTRNRKNIVLTEVGKAFCDKAIAEIIALEERVYAQFSEEEINAGIAFFRKLNTYLAKELQ